MSRRNGLLLCVASLSAAFLVGCSSHPAMGINPLDHVPELPDPQMSSLQSPYHPQSTANVPLPTTVQSAHHESSATDEPPPPKKEETPPPLAALPPQPAQPTPPTPVVPPPQESKKIAPSEEPLVVALRALMQKHPDEAVKTLGRYPKANQDMLLVMLPLAARLTEGDINKLSPREAADLADMVQGVEERLRQHAALRIEKMLFCRKIDDFGEYVVRETVSGLPTFEAGTGNQPGEPIQVYVELRNVASKQHGDCYETRLAGSIELFDSLQHQPAYQKSFRPEIHQGKSARHDFFVNCSFSVPRNVPPGRYTLRLEVRDITGLPIDPSGLPPTPPAQRIARQELDLQVIAPKPDRSATASR